jgi:hypothetical protein
MRVVDNKKESSRLLSSIVPYSMSHHKHVWWHWVLTVGWVGTRGLVAGSAWMVMAVVGMVVLRLGDSPYNLVVGLPMVGIGWGLLIHEVWTNILAVVSGRFNEESCLICMWRRRHLFQ